MDLGKVFNLAEKFVVDNLPTILTGVGVVGTVGTAYLTHRSTKEATTKVHVENLNRQNKASIAHEPFPPFLTKTEEFKLTWMSYIPPVAAGVTTISAIVFANRISTKRAAALAAAYALSEGRLSEYKEKVKEKIGVNKESKIEDELAQDRVNAKPPSEAMLIVAEGEILCKDEFSGRYFHSTVEKVRRAENEVNSEIIRSGFATVTDFYDRIGLPPTSASEAFGWNGRDRLEMATRAVITPEGKPCICFDYDAKPIREYNSCAAD